MDPNEKNKGFEREQKSTVCQISKLASRGIVRFNLSFGQILNEIGPLTRIFILISVQAKILGRF